MLRLHFSVEDLANVRLAPEWSPMGEALMSLQLLRRGDRDSRFALWRQGLRGRLPDEIRPVWDLVPPRGWIPDFLTPYHDAMTPATYLEAIRSTPGRLIAADLNKLAAVHRPPTWAGTLTHADPDALHAVTRALATYHQVAIAPHADPVRAAQDAERSHMATIWRRQGIGAVLERTHPRAQWQAPVLTLPSTVDRQVHLAGRGLILAPLMFCGSSTRLWIGDQDGPALLAYRLPFDPTAANPLAAPLPSPRSRQAPRALADLLGATRARVLAAVTATPGLTTAELANCLGVSLASASEHATTLRRAGLTHSRRDGHRIHHYPTPTATALLNAG